MKTTLYIVLAVGIAIVAFLFGQMYQPSGIQELFGQSSRDRDVAGGSEFSLSKDQVQKAIESANLGSKEAARSLYFYYSFSESNKSAANRWQLALADMGDTFSQHALMKEYFTAHDDEKRKEGIERCKAWLEQPKAEEP
jgi:hypothetical protein